MKIQIALRLSQTTNAQVLRDSTYYTNAIASNAFFAADDLEQQVQSTVEATNNLRNSIDQPNSDAKKDRVKGCRSALDRQLKILASKIEDIANHPKIPDEGRQAIVHDAGMSLKNTPTPKRKRVFRAKNTNIEGVVYLEAPGGVLAHEWQYTEDVSGLTKRINLPGTSISSTEVLGLEIGKRYAFFHRAIISKKKTDWEGPLFLTVS
jgi:hypothetical protein